MQKNPQLFSILAATTAAPATSDSAVVAGNSLLYSGLITYNFAELPFVSHVHTVCFPVVIVVIVLTVAVLAFLLYRYLCHNKGAYRTTGELAPGEDPDEDFTNQTSSEKKEYFI